MIRTTTESEEILRANAMIWNIINLSGIPAISSLSVAKLIGEISGQIEFKENSEAV
jgi:hypothetical protein